MKLIALTLSVASLLLVACAREDEPAAPPEPVAEPSSVALAGGDGQAAPEPAATVGQEDQAAAPEAGDEEVLAAVKRLVAEMTRAYQAAPVLIDTIDERFVGPGMKPPGNRHVVRIGQGTDVHISDNNNQVVAIGGSVYLTSARFPDRYLRVALVEDVVTTSREILGGTGGVGSLQCALRYGKSMDDILFTMALGAPVQPRLSGYHAITDADGRAVEQITLNFDGGTSVINVDAETKLIRSAVTQIEAPEVNLKLTRELIFDTQVLDELPQPIVFDPGDRIEVSTIGEFNGKPDRNAEHPKLRVSPGEAAPDFTLPTPFGEEITLSSLRGSVVVLEFWARWRPECGESLKQLNEFQQLMAGANMPVEVLAVNVQEREADFEKRMNYAAAYFRQHGVDVPCVVDLEGSVSRAYGIIGLPTRLVIDQRGTIFGAQWGYDRLMVRKLQQEVALAIEVGRKLGEGDN